MNPSYYRLWTQRAFLYVEGALLQQAAHDSPTQITEEAVRAALSNGLKCAKPDRSQDVVTEENTPWNTAKDVKNPSRVLGRGRPKQHDVAVRQNGILEAVCEVKWLKTQDHSRLVQDLWKLALTHGVAAQDRNCCRTFMLVGGEKNCFQDTLQELRDKKYSIYLHWSPQGRAAGLPRANVIKFGNLANRPEGFEELKAVLQRGANYYRTPPDIWWELRCSVLARDWRTVRGFEWKIALWELDYHLPCRQYRVDWSNLGASLP
jgi:hypothetical protein